MSYLPLDVFVAARVRQPGSYFTLNIYFLPFEVVHIPEIFEGDQDHANLDSLARLGANLFGWI